MPNPSVARIHLPRALSHHGPLVVIASSTAVHEKQNIHSLVFTNVHVLALYSYELSLSYFTEEFVAHGANVNCLALGHKSGRVMVTGGEDKKVNMWAVGKPNCIMVSHTFFIQYMLPQECSPINVCHKSKY